MPFWTAVETEPKRSFRYLFYMSGRSQTIQPYTVQTVKKPSFTIEGQVQAKYIQHTFKYPGRVMWQDVTVTIIDPRGAGAAGVDDAAKTLDTVLLESGYSAPLADDAFAKASISKVKATNAMGTPFLVEINAEGLEISRWTLKNPYLANVDYGQLSYNEDSLVTYTLTISYDYATYETTSQDIQTDGAISSIF